MPTPGHPLGREGEPAHLAGGTDDGHPPDGLGNEATHGVDLVLVVEVHVKGFGKVVDGMDTVEKINGEYGEGAPRGRGPDQGRIQAEGNAYLKKDFPNLDYIKSATIVE